MKYLKNVLAIAMVYIISLGSVGLALSGQALAMPLNAAAPSIVADSRGDACAGLQQLGGGTNCGSATSSPGQNKIANIARTVVNIISFIGGIAAVILIVIGGIRFITSGGDSNGVSAAKNTIIYAIIGLVVIALAQALVHFVLNAVINNQVSGS